MRNPQPCLWLPSPLALAKSPQPPWPSPQHTARFVFCLVLVLKRHPFSLLPGPQRLPLWPSAFLAHLSYTSQHEVEICVCVIVMSPSGMPLNSLPPTHCPLQLLRSPLCPWADPTQARSAELSLLALSLQWTLEAHPSASASPSILSFPALQIPQKQPLLEGAGLLPSCPLCLAQATVSRGPLSSRVPLLVAFCALAERGSAASSVCISPPRRGSALPFLFSL